ncbi:MAG: RNA polymerase factor sigma-54, partial [Alphaproteobacteria bacterium]
EDEAEAVLDLLQRLEPEGVFARDLAECLYIQAREQGVLSPVMTLVLENLEILGRGDMQVLARKAKCDIADIADCLRQIREFNPKPGEAYEVAPLRISAPDVIVSRGPDGWVVDLNRSTLPSLVINEEYAAAVNVAKRKGDDEEAKTYASEALGSARWLRRALDQRNSTTLKISGEIVARQADFLTHGLSALKPLSLKNVAEAVGMHESTVSRVTSGLMLATPKGSFPMKSLFSVSIASSDDGDSKAAGAVRDMIKSIVEAEPAGKPLSDDAIAAMVSEKGVKLARRTVAKYREMLRIPSSSERRRRAKLNMAG